jgi:hypothetical protein
MNGEVENAKDEVEVDTDVEEAPAPDDTVVLTEDLADIGDGTDTIVESNVDELVAKIDRDEDAEHKKEVHRRLVELEEKKIREEELDSTYNFNLDDEL